MTAKIQDIQQYSFTATDKILLDANIWLRVYGPQSDSKNFLTKTYSLALKKILTATARIHLDALVLSEFINRWARLEYQTLPSTERPANFKEFRSSMTFQPIAADIAKTSQSIVAQCTRVESGFEPINITDTLARYAAGESDFTDLMLTQLCKRLDLKFVTHDSDFKTSGLDLLTANPKLLS